MGCAGGVDQRVLGGNSPPLTAAKGCYVFLLMGDLRNELCNVGGEYPLMTMISFRVLPENQEQSDWLLSLRDEQACVCVCVFLICVCVE